MKMSPQPISPQDRQTLSAEVSPVRTYLSLGNAPAFPGSVLDSGGTWWTPFAWLDRDTSSWRTWQRSFSETWEPFSQTWPRYGMTQNGIAYRRLRSVLSTDETDGGRWRTPCARDWKGYTKRAGESICNQLRQIFGGTGVPLPRFIEKLMGYPSQWTALEPSENTVVPQIPELIGRAILEAESKEGLHSRFGSIVNR